MAKKKFVGEKIGLLTILSEIPNYRTSGGTKIRAFHCVCDCGTECDRTAVALRQDECPSCGCNRKTKIAEGAIFGQLTVIKEIIPSALKSRTFLCKCSCGNECIRTRQALLKSCDSHCGCKNPRPAKIGDRFGPFTIIDNDEDYISPKGERRTRFIVQCSCGRIMPKTINRLRQVKYEKCICETNLPQKWGRSVNSYRLYHIWQGIKRRCTSFKTSVSKNYALRGISMCDEWMDNFGAFQEWALSNGYTDDLTIDRIDVDGNYEPSNCRWATRSTQSRNKRNTLYLTCNGETKTIADWSDQIGIAYGTIIGRIKKYGWTAEQALGFEPAKSRKGVPRPYSRKPILQLKDGIVIREWESGYEIEKELGITRRTMQHILSGDTKNTRGFDWVYKGDYNDRRD